MVPAPIQPKKSAILSIKSANLFKKDVNSSIGSPKKSPKNVQDIFRPLTEFL